MTPLIIFTVLLIITIIVLAFWIYRLKNPVKTVTPGNIYLKSHGKCPNYNANCTAWAKAGECNKNPSYMLNDCPGACESCNTTYDEAMALGEQVKVAAGLT